MTGDAPASDEAIDVIRIAVSRLIEARIPVLIVAEARWPNVAPAGSVQPDFQLASLLVPPDCQPEAFQLLIDTGWSTSSEDVAEKAIGGIAARHMWSLSLDRATIELHHFAIALNRLRGDDDRLWRYSIPVLWRGLAVRATRREHSLLLAMVESICGSVERRAAWLERGRLALDGPPLDWPELLHDIRLRGLEAILHAGLSIIGRDPAAPVPAEVLTQLAAQTSDLQKAELAHRTQPTDSARAANSRIDYESALARYRRRQKVTDATRAAATPAAAISLELPSDGVTVWVNIPDDTVATEWMVLRVTADLPAVLLDGYTSLQFMFPGLPIGDLPIARAAGWPPRRSTTMLQFHQGFLQARRIDKLGLALARNGGPSVGACLVPVQIDCLIAVTTDEPIPVRPLSVSPPKSYLLASRIVLCRPRGGLNDMLNQIEICWSYAERFRRRLVVDASRSGIRGAFSDYFCLRDADANVVLHPSSADEVTFDLLSAEPAALTGRVSTYAARQDGHLGHCWQYEHRKVPVRFDRNRDYPAALVLHEQSGGGRDSLAALRRLRFTEQVAAAINSRVEPLGSGYLGVHVRQTDHPIDAEAFLHSLRESVAGKRVLICSDDPAIVAKAKLALCHSDVFAASTLQDTKGRPQHFTSDDEDAFPDPAARHRANLEALVDLVALARADRVFLTRGFSGSYSGFGMLAKLLCEQPDVLAGMVA